MNVDLRNRYNDDVSLGLYRDEQQFSKFGKGFIGIDKSTIWTGTYKTGVGLYEYPYASIKLGIRTESQPGEHHVTIYGLDKNWKLQSETVLTNGITQVSTKYEYIRIFRALVEDGGDLQSDVLITEYGHISTLYAHISGRSNGVANQSQMAMLSVPVGYTYLVDEFEISTFNDNKIHLETAERAFIRCEECGYTNPPFRVISNFNITSASSQFNRTRPVPIVEKSDFEIRAWIENDEQNSPWSGQFYYGGQGDKDDVVDVITAQIHGVLVRLNSVPIDLGSFSAVAGTESIIVSWDLQTPAETQDMANFVVDVYSTKTNKLVSQKILIDKESVGVTVDGLVTGVEYKVDAYWVGYDGLRSTIETADITVL